QQRASANAVVAGGGEALEKAVELVLVELSRLRAGLGRLGELDVLRTRHGEIEHSAEFEKAAKRDEVHVFRGGRNWSLAGIAAREKPPSRQMTGVGVQDADIDSAHARCVGAALDELTKLEKEERG